MSTEVKPRTWWITRRFMRALNLGTWVAEVYEAEPPWSSLLVGDEKIKLIEHSAFEASQERNQKWEAKYKRALEEMKKDLAEIESLREKLAAAEALIEQVEDIAKSDMGLRIPLIIEAIEANKKARGV